MKYLELFEIVKTQSQEMFDTQGTKIEKAAQAMAETIKHDGLIHVFGCGHSQMFAQEMFYRAGGLVPVNALLIPHLSLNPVAKLSTLMERMEGFVETYLDLEHTTPHDTMIIVSVSGRNGAVVDMALAAKKKNMTVIGLTSEKFSSQVSSRHSSNQKLADVADIVIDINCEFGDAALSMEGLPHKFVGTSTILGMMIIESLVAQTIENLVNDGVHPPIWVSSNTEAGDEINKVHIKNYKDKISCL